MFYKSTPSARRRARRLALQGIYQWQMTKVSANQIQIELLKDLSSSKTDVPYFKEILEGVCDQSELLDEKIQPSLDRRIEEVDPVERAILRLAVYELMYRIDVPYKVVIDEALRLAKTFGATEGFKYVNGILDKVACSVRSAEYQKKV